jgi:hypothetical protein
MAAFPGANPDHFALTAFAADCLSCPQPEKRRESEISWLSPSHNHQQRVKKSKPEPLTTLLLGSILCQTKQHQETASVESPKGVIAHQHRDQTVTENPAQIACLFSRVEAGSRNGPEAVPATMPELQTGRHGKNAAKPRRFGRCRGQWRRVPSPVRLPQHLGSREIGAADYRN